MAKLAILACFLVALLAIVDARTIIKTHSESQCSEERGLVWKHCGYYLTVGPALPDLKGLCCEEMIAIRSECRCEAMQEVFERSVAKPGKQGEEEMLEAAKNLPSTCEWSDWEEKPTECPISTLKNSFVL